MNERLLSPELLPDSLWISKDDLLHISPEINKAYCAMIVDFGLSKMIGPNETATDPFGTLVSLLYDYSLLSHMLLLKY